MLGSLALAIVVGLVLVGACLSLVVSSTPKHTLEVPLGELTAGLPRFYPQPSFGADASGRTFGVWVLVPDDGPTRAFMSRDPRTGCFVDWRGDLTVDETRGVFRDPCHGSSYRQDGGVVFGPAARGLDEFDLEVGSGSIVIDLERFRLGMCREGVPPDEQIPCSTADRVRYEDEQPVLLDGSTG